MTFIAAIPIWRSVGWMHIAPKQRHWITSDGMLPTRHATTILPKSMGRFNFSSLGVDLLARSTCVIRQRSLQYICLGPWRRHPCLQFLRRRRDDRHRPGLDRRKHGIRLCGEKGKQLKLALKRHRLCIARAKPGRPDAGKAKQRPCFVQSDVGVLRGFASSCSPAHSRRGGLLILTARLVFI